MTREPIEVTRQDRIYCLKASSDYHRELCEECRFYPNCDHMTQDDLAELTIEDLETLDQEPKTSYLSIDDVMSVFDDFMRGEVDEEDTETFLEMLKDKAGSEVKE